MIHLDGSRRVIQCKHCRKPVHAQYRDRHLQECRAYQRRQKLNRMTFEKNGKQLYAIAIQRPDVTGKHWLPEMHYAHGIDAAEARRTYLLGEKDRLRVHIVNVGLAIGMFAVDRDGKLLVAD